MKKLKSFTISITIAVLLFACMIMPNSVYASDGKNAIQKSGPIIIQSMICPKCHTGMLIANTDTVTEQIGSRKCIHTYYYPYGVDKCFRDKYTKTTTCNVCDYYSITVSYSTSHWVCYGSLHRNHSMSGLFIRSDFSNKIGA